MLSSFDSFLKLNIEFNKFYKMYKFHKQISKNI